MKKFRASFSSTGDSELDAELHEIETEEHPIDDIVATCAKCNVSARIIGESGNVLGEVERGGYRALKR